MINPAHLAEAMKGWNLRSPGKGKPRRAKQVVMDFDAPAGQDERNAPGVARSFSAPRRPRWNKKMAKESAEASERWNSRFELLAAYWRFLEEGRETRRREDATCRGGAGS